MIRYVRSNLDPAREALARSISTAAPLDEVATAIAAASEHQRLLYVERVPGGYRWSLAHRGGPYPLLRTTALFLRVDYHELFVGCRPLGNGVSIIGTAKDRTPTEGEWTLLELDGPTSAADIKAHIERHLAP